MGYIESRASAISGGLADRSAYGKNERSKYWARYVCD